MIQDEEGPVLETQYPRLIFSTQDYQRRIGFHKLNADKAEALKLWREHDIIGRNRLKYIKQIQRKNDKILQVTEKDELEQNEVYVDKYPLLKLRKSIKRIFIYINLVASAIISTSTFDNISILVIMLNSMVMMSEDPTNSEPNPFYAQIDQIFLVLYSVEMVLKILGMGLIFGPKAYLQDSWNILDFVIVLSGYLTLINEMMAGEQQGNVDVAGDNDNTSSGVDLSGLRVFRVMRPLKTISSIKGLKVLMQALFGAIPLLRDTIIILLFFFIIFAIGGTQLMAGNLKNRCISIQTGMVHPDDLICGSAVCPGGYFCGQSNDNPNFGVTNFDNILYSLLVVFQSVTLEGWSDIQRMMQRAYMYSIFIYFLPLVFIGAFFLLNLTLAVINSKFTEAHHEQEAKDEAIQAAAKKIERGDGAEGDQELNNLIESKDDMSIAQFFSVKKAAKKMIQFLRMRQQQKIEELERLKKEEEEAEAERESNADTEPKKQFSIFGAKMSPAKKSEKKGSGNLKRSMTKATGPRKSQPLSPNTQVKANIVKKDLSKSSKLSVQITPLHLGGGSPSPNMNTITPKSSSTPMRKMRTSAKFLDSATPTIIAEEEYSEQNLSEQEALEKDVLDFLKNTKSKMQQDQLTGKSSMNFNIQIPKKGERFDKKQRTVKKDDVFTFDAPIFKPDSNLKMKGIIGQKTKKKSSPTKQLAMKNIMRRDQSRRRVQVQPIDFERDLDIDEVIPKELQMQNFFKSDSSTPVCVPKDNNNSFQTLNDENANEDIDIDPNIRIPDHFQTLQPDKNSKKRKGNDSILISSDSDFDQAEFEAGHQMQKQKLIEQKKQARKAALSRGLNKSWFEHVDGDADQSEAIQKIQYTSKNVSKTFKKMLTTHSNISKKMSSINIPKEEVASTHYGAEREIEMFTGNISQTDKGSNRRDRVINELESKFSKKNTVKMKIYDEDIKQLFDKKNKKKGDKYNIESVQEYTHDKQKRDPYANLDKFTQKVGITKDVIYISTSQNDVLSERFQDRVAQTVMKNNPMLKKAYTEDKDFDIDLHQPLIIRSPFDPYQQKIFFEAEEDSSEMYLTNDSNDEDQLCAQDQPYQTLTAVNYGQLISKAPIKELARRSDIMITSTISMSIFPNDKRLISLNNRSDMTERQIMEYIDSKNAFQAMCKDHNYKAPNIRDKDKLLRDNYLRSFIHKQDFSTKTLATFKENVRFMNLNKKPVIANDEDEIRLKAEQLKHQQNMRASEKRGLPFFTLELAMRLLNGHFHEEDEEDEEIADPDASNDNRDKDELNEAHIAQMKKFEEQLKVIMAPKEFHVSQDEVPRNIRQEFGFPDTLGEFEINFEKIRLQDHSKKKFRPMWSGQDVFPDQLNFTESQIPVKLISQVRVWPLGVRGKFKRIRFMLRQFIRASIFDTSMTFAVLLNTIVLSIDHYGIAKETSDILNQCNSYFTNIFIFEMGVKLLALGVKKYCSDKMNYLDGFVVLISIFELIYTALSDGQNMSTFKTISVFRTFRVFRIARLLRALESMQTILGVIARSYKSFIYITLLMCVFIFIFSLLGMQIYGGKFDYEDGKPRGNFDSFSIAAITVFQVLTMENWIAVLIDSMRGEINKFIISIYYIAWIFMGNFILLNLFLAILLDSFLEEEDENENEDDKERREQKLIRAHQRKIRKQKKIVLMGNNSKKPSAIYFGQAKGESEEDLEDLDEEQVMQIFKEQGYMKKDINEIQDQKLYIGIECQASFYIFDKDIWLRQQCYRLINLKIWDNAVMVLIFASSIKLGFDTYFLDAEKDSLIMIISTNIDLFFNFSFIFEMCVKLIAIGFIMDEGSYLRESWNQLDFFIVMSSILDMLLTGSDLQFIKILRLLRTLRPLRVISHNVALKMIVIALLESVGGIFNVTIVVLMVWLIFAIMGVNSFGGKFFYCSIDMYVLHTQNQCEFAGGKWKVYDHNFDNVVTAMNTLFIVSSLEGWPDIMLQAVDSTNINMGPKEEASVGNSLYFVIFIMIGSFFFLNFFIGVLFLKYNQAQKEEQKGFSSQDLGWMDIQRLILSSNPEYETTNVPNAAWRKRFHDLVSSERFDMIIMSCIVLNMIQMACFYEGMSTGIASILDFSNYIFTAIFIIEAMCKIIAFGGSYLKNAWNKFDFFVVISSIFDIVLGALDQDTIELLQVGPQLARVMRVLRVTRVLRLAGKAEGLQAIIQTIMFSIPVLFNVFMLLMLIFFMFSILGVFMFGNVKSGDVIDDLKNFNNFFNAFLLLFAITTGEDWNKIMFDCSRTPPNCVPDETCGKQQAFIYFFSIILVCSHVMLNLFILVIIQQFEKYYLPTENMITLFKKDQANFMQAWKIFTQDRYKCFKIKEKQLQEFFRKLGEKGDKETSLGFAEEFYDDGELKKQLLKMGIKSDNGFIYFNELLYRCMRRKYGNFKVNQKMQIFELRTQFQIYQKTLEIQNKGLKRLQNKDIFNSIIKKENGVNPFLTVMNFKISFKTWIKYARIKMKENAFNLLVSTASKEVLERQKQLLAEDKKIRHFTVEIQNEKIYSCTSEEDLYEQYMKAQKKKEQEQKANQMIEGVNEGRPSNHLDLFEKKMLKKLKKSSKVNNDFRGNFKQRIQSQIEQKIAEQAQKYQ